MLIHSNKIWCDQINNIMINIFHTKLHLVVGMGFSLLKILAFPFSFMCYINGGPIKMWIAFNESLYTFYDKNSTVFMKNQEVNIWWTLCCVVLFYLASLTILLYFQDHLCRFCGLCNVHLFMLTRTHASSSPPLWKGPYPIDSHHH